MLRPSILDRYLFREAGLTWFAVTVVLLAIMLSTRFTRFLGMAAKGLLPPELVFQVVALSSIQYLVILVPVSLLLAIMLALGRMYRDAEMSAIAACGVSLRALYRPFVRLGVVLACLCAILSFVASPWAGRTADYLIKQSQQDLAFSAFEAGQFRTVPELSATLYVNTVYPEAGVLDEVFIRTFGESGDGVVLADKGEQRVDPETGERRISMINGHRYEGRAGEASWRVLSFAEQGVRIAPPEFFYRNSERKIARTRMLMANPDLADIAELQWRISAPLSVLLLAILAVPLSHVRPRAGRYSKLVVGIVVYAAYANGLGLAQAWVAKGQLSPWLGLWWVHALVLLACYLLYLRRQGRLRLRSRRSGSAGHGVQGAAA